MTTVTRALMIQGTASHAGKSLIVAGLCRLFLGEGLRVVPFKSQNMALNAYVTRDGGEMGWALIEGAGNPAEPNLGGSGTRSVSALDVLPYARIDLSAS